MMTAERETTSTPMPEVRAQGAEMRQKVAAFFDLAVEALPPVGTTVWSRLLATYVWTMRPGYGVKNLRHMPDRKIFDSERSS